MNQSDEEHCPECETCSEHQPCCYWVGSSENYPHPHRTENLMACECGKCNTIPQEVDVDVFRPGINQGPEVWNDLVEIQEDDPNKFLVWYRGPGIHPDHPTNGCEDCGHLSDCGTHSIPAYPSEPCNCMNRKPLG